MSIHALPEERPHVVKDAKGKRPQFYDTAGMDQVMSMLLVLANEVSVLHDRIDSMERVSKAHGLDMAAEIEALTLDQPALEAREAWRQNFLERLYYLLRKEAKETAENDSAEKYTATIDDIAQG
jgi:hypothetical protein